MKTSTKTEKIAAALAAVQAQLQHAQRTATNPEIGNRYATLATVRELSRPLLAEQGLSISQSVELGEQSALVTRLSHTSGQWMEARVPLLYHPRGGMQQLASAMTMGRRYGECAILGIATEDDDGEAAMGRGAGQAQQQRREERDWREEIAKELAYLEKASTRVGLQARLKYVWQTYKGEQHPVRLAVIPPLREKLAALEQRAAGGDAGGEAAAA